MGLVILITYVVVAFFITGGARGKAYTQDYMKQFYEEHKQAFNDEFKQKKGRDMTDDDLKSTLAGGYPDVGNGRFSRHLSYTAWMNMNNG